MKKDDVCYGTEEQEHLDMDPEETLDRIIEDACEVTGESIDLVLDRLTYPIKVRVFKRITLDGWENIIAANVLEETLDRLDEEMGDPEGDAFEPTEAMHEAATAFAKVVVAEYVPWACIPTGETIEYTRKRVEEIKGDWHVQSNRPPEMPARRRPRCAGDV
jgi:hypothetical protein